MLKPNLRRACAALAAGTSLALALTGCGGTTKDDVKADNASAASAGKADPNAATKKGLTVGFLPSRSTTPTSPPPARAGGRRSPNSARPTRRWGRAAPRTPPDR